MIDQDLEEEYGLLLCRNKVLSQRIAELEAENQEAWNACDAAETRANRAEAKLARKNRLINDALINTNDYMVKNILREALNQQEASGG